jgi:hypothetical protein
MNTSDRFLRFAAECEVMAKFSRTSENRAVWNGLAERWVRCAKLMDRKDSEYYTPLPEAPSKGHLQFGALTKSRHARELLGFTPLLSGSSVSCVISFRTSKMFASGVMLPSD